MACAIAGSSISRRIAAAIAHAERLLDEGAHILDIGSVIGGPARYFAQRFAYRVTDIDLTAEFCDVAQQLTQAWSAATGLAAMAQDVATSQPDRAEPAFADPRGSRLNDIAMRYLLEIYQQEKDWAKAIDPGSFWSRFLSASMRASSATV